MLRRLISHLLPLHRVWLPHVVALLASGVITLVSFLPLCRYLMTCDEAHAAMRVHQLPAEGICLVPYAADHEVPKFRRAMLPVLRLREYAPGKYELLYWGNPIRSRYAFSVRSLLTGSSVLLSGEGKPLLLHPLPVTEPRRADGKLPLQPIVKLHNIRGREGDLFAVRVAVHDADKGTVLCSEVYLISGSSAR